MGRPVNKNFFGADAIHCVAKVSNAAAADGFIVKQTATREFIVNVSGTELKCRLVDKEISDLAIGEMVINVESSSGEIMRVTAFKGHKLTTNEGEQFVWNTRAGTPAPLQVSTTDQPVVDVPLPTPVAPTVVENTSLSAMFATSNSRMLVGNGNPINKMIVATDGQIEVAVAAGVVGSSATNPVPVDGHFVIQLEANQTNVNGVPIKHDWNFRYAFGLLQNPRKKALTDLYDIAITVTKDGSPVAKYELLEKNQSFVVTSPVGDLTDNYVGQYGDVIQNVQRLSYVDPQFVVGSFEFNVTAAPKTGGTPVVIQFTTDALAPVTQPTLPTQPPAQGGA